MSRLLRAAPTAPIFLLCICILAVFSPRHASAEDARPVLKIGALVSLSGGLEQFGDEIVRGYTLAEEEPSAVKVSVVVEDDRSINKVATVAAAKKLIDFDGVAVLLNWTAASTPPLVPIATAAKIPLVVGAYDSNVRASGRYVFGCQVNYELLPGHTADFMVKRLGAKRIAIISAADYWSQTFPAPFKARAVEDGAQIVLEEVIDPSTNDLKGLLLRAQKLGADGIFAPIYSNALYALVKQSRELKFKGIIHGADGIFEADVKSLGADAEGIYSTQIWVDDKNFRDRVMARFGKAESALQLGMIAGAYDGVVHLRQIAEEIVKRGGMLTRESIFAGIQTHRSQGILGAMFLPDPPGDAGERDVQVKNGAFVLADAPK